MEIGRKFDIIQVFENVSKVFFFYYFPFAFGENIIFCLIVFKVLPGLLLLPILL